MSLPISYYIPDMPEAGPQAVSNADRPLCALMSAVYAARNGARVKQAGAPVGWVDLIGYAKDKNVPLDRASLWYAGLEGETLSVDRVWREIGGVTLSPYQEETIARITAAGGVLNLGCGLGKTVTAIAAVMNAQEHDAVSDRRVWIVCPLNAVAAWRPYESFLHSVGVKEVQIISMDSLHKCPASNIGGCIIFDECHLLGEPTARRTKAAHAVRPMFDFALCLTGTLLHGGVHKALSVLDLAIPGGALFASKWRAGEYFKCLVRKKIGARTVTSLERPTGQNKERFMEYLSRLTVCMTKDSPAVRSDITIPEQTLQTIEIGDCSRDLTDLAVEYIQRALEKDPSKMVHAMEVAQALCQEGVSAKVDWLLDQIDAPDQGIVVFCQYTESLDYVEKALADEGISCVRVDGSVTGKKREQAIAAFQGGEVQVFLGQITAAGISANLQRAYVSVAIDHTWRAADYAQALARTCRRGQNSECYHFDLVSNKLQKRVVERLRMVMDFDSSTADWQALKNILPKKDIA